MTNKDEYFIDEADSGLGRCLVLTVPWSDSFKKIIEKENISVIRLSNSAGWKGDSISFLADLTGLRGVEIYAWGVKDLTPLQSIPNLEYIGLQCEFTKSPDFSVFTNLKICKLFWRPKAKSIFTCLGLRFLNIVNYPSSDLQDIRQLESLERLQLTSKKLTTLSGIENLQSLSVLDLAGCSKLGSISGVNKCHKIYEVEIEGCKGFNDVSFLGELPKLKKLMLEDCGKIKSLCSLAKCQFLESLIFSGDTDIEDGELTPLLEFPNLNKVWFADREHYSHDRDQIKKILS